MNGKSKPKKRNKINRGNNQSQHNVSNRQTDKLISSNSSNPVHTPSDSQNLKVCFKPYDLDYEAQKLVLANRDQKNVLNESHKMRMAVAYGLERFWGEHLRYKSQSKQDNDENSNKSQYWKSVWEQLAKILIQGGVDLPNHLISTVTDKNNEEQKKKQTEEIQKMAEALWTLPLDEQRIALMVLSQFCDALVWWTQRYKTRNAEDSTINLED